MPELGEIRKGTDIGYKCHGLKYIWHACSDCGKERWVSIIKGMPEYERCASCARKRQIPPGVGAYSKGKRKNSGGYIRISSPNHPRADKNGNVLEHRLVMEQQLGRYLLPSEKVHHRNGFKDDNRWENLELISPANHLLYKSMCAHCQLRKEIRLLRWQMTELTKQLQGSF